MDPTGAVFGVDDCASWMRSWEATVPPKSASRQRESALRLFCIALFSCRYSPGPEEREEVEGTYASTAKPFSQSILKRNLYDSSTRWPKSSYVAFENITLVVMCVVMSYNRLSIRIVKHRPRFTEKCKLVEVVESQKQSIGFFREL